MTCDQSKSQRSIATAARPIRTAVPSAARYRTLSRFFSVSVTFPTRSLAPFLTVLRQDREDPPSFPPIPPHFPTYWHHQLPSFNCPLAASARAYLMFLTRVHQIPAFGVEVLSTRITAFSRALLSFFSSTERTSQANLRLAVERYFKFLQLKTKYPNTVLVPEVDIEYIWLTHLIRPGTYRQGCLPACSFSKITLRGQTPRRCADEWWITTGNS